MAGHKYSTKFKKNVNLPYAKVGKQVFRSLYDAETYCAENGLDQILQSLTEKARS